MKTIVSFVIILFIILQIRPGWSLGGDYVKTDTSNEDLVLAHYLRHSRLNQQQEQRDQRGKLQKLILKTSLHSQVIPSSFPCTDIDPHKTSQLPSGKGHAIKLCDLCPQIPFLERTINVRLNIKPKNPPKTVLNPSACLSLCLNQSDCMALHFDSKTGLCSLYNSTEGETSRHEDSIQIMIIQPTANIRNWVYSRNTMISLKSNMSASSSGGRRGEIQIISNLDFPSCLMKCELEESGGCNSVNYEIQTKKCFLIKSSRLPSKIANSAFQLVDYHYGYLAAFNINQVYPQEENNNNFWRFKLLPNIESEKRKRLFQNTFQFNPPSKPMLRTHDFLSTLSCRYHFTPESEGCEWKSGRQRCRYPENIPPSTDTFLPLCPHSRHVQYAKIKERFDILDSCFQQCLTPTTTTTGDPSSSSSCIGVNFHVNLNKCQVVKLEDFERSLALQSKNLKPPKSSKVEESTKLFFALRIPLATDYTNLVSKYSINVGLGVSPTIDPSLYPPSWLTKLKNVSTLAGCSAQCEKSGIDCLEFLYDFTMKSCVLVHQGPIPLTLTPSSLSFSKIEPITSILSVYNSLRGYDFVNSEQDDILESVSLTSTILTGSTSIATCLHKCDALEACHLVTTTLSFDLHRKTLSVECTFMSLDLERESELNLNFYRQVNTTIWIKIQNAARLNTSFEQKQLDKMSLFSQADFPLSCSRPSPTLSFSDLEKAFQPKSSVTPLTKASILRKGVSKPKYTAKKPTSQPTGSVDEDNLSDFRSTAHQILDLISGPLTNLANDSSPLVASAHEPILSKIYHGNFPDFSLDFRVNNHFGLFWEIPLRAIKEKSSSQKKKSGSQVDDRSSILLTQLPSYGSSQRGLQFLPPPDQFEGSKGRRTQNLLLSLEDFDEDEGLSSIVRYSKYLIRTNEFLHFGLINVTTKGTEMRRGQKSRIKRSKGKSTGKSEGGGEDDEDGVWTIKKHIQSLPLDESRIQIVDSQFACGEHKLETLKLVQCLNGQLPQQLTLPFCLEDKNRKRSWKYETGETKCEPQDCKLFENTKIDLFGVRARHPQSLEKTIYTYVAKYDKVNSLPIFTATLIDNLNTMPVLPTMKKEKLRRGTIPDPVDIDIKYKLSGTKKESNFFARHPCRQLINYQPTSEDYKSTPGMKTMFDRGHLTPHALLNALGDKAVETTYLMINIGAQDEQTNKNHWQPIEDRVFTFLKMRHGVIITGLCPHEPSHNEIFIKSQHITNKFPLIATCFWKLVCYVEPITSVTHVVAFMAENLYSGWMPHEQHQIRMKLLDGREEGEAQPIQNVVSKIRKLIVAMGNDNNKTKASLEKVLQTEPHDDFNLLFTKYIEAKEIERERIAKSGNMQLRNQQEVIDRMGWDSKFVNSMWTETIEKLKENRINSERIPTGKNCADATTRDPRLDWPKMVLSPKLPKGKKGEGGGEGRKGAEKPSTSNCPQDKPGGKSKNSDKISNSGGKTKRSSKTPAAQETSKSSSPKFGSDPIDQREHQAFLSSFQQSPPNVEMIDQPFASASCGGRLVAYFDGKNPKASFTYVQGVRVTHAIFLSLPLLENGNLMGWQELQTNYPQLHSNWGDFLHSMAMYPNVKGMVAIGRETTQGVWDMGSIARDPLKRLNLIQSILSLVENDLYRLDGIDLQWTHFTSLVDKVNFVTLLKMLRVTMDAYAEENGWKTKFLMSVMGVADAHSLDLGFELEGMMKYVDWINLLPMDSPLGFQDASYLGSPSPLYPPGGLDGRGPGKKYVYWTVRHYVCRGVKPWRLNLGIPFYGNLYAKQINMNVKEEFRKWPTGGGRTEKSVLRYAEVKEIEQKTEVVTDSACGRGMWKMGFHSVAKIPFLTNSEKNGEVVQFLAHENPDSVKEKVEHVEQWGLGGFALWTVDQDEEGYSMLEAVGKADLCKVDAQAKKSFKCSPIRERRWASPDFGPNAPKCGRQAPTINGFYAVCNPDDPNFGCCGPADGGTCGSGPEFCMCPTCINYFKDPQKVLNEPVKPPPPPPSA